MSTATLHERALALLQHDLEQARHDADYHDKKANRAALFMEMANIASREHWRMKRDGAMEMKARASARAEELAYILAMVAK